MKKTIAFFLAFIMLFAFPLSSFAFEKADDISIRLTNDIAGLDYNDYEKIAIILSDSITYTNTLRYNCIQINDYAGNVYLEKMKPGRTYSVHLSFMPAEGFEFPEELTSSMVNIICEEGCTVWWWGKTVGTADDGVSKEYFLSVSAEITVKGNFFQRIFGRLADIFLKIKAWSPY